MKKSESLKALASAFGRDSRVIEENYTNIRRDRPIETCIECGKAAFKHIITAKPKTEFWVCSYECLLGFCPSPEERMSVSIVAGEFRAHYYGATAATMQEGEYKIPKYYDS